MDVHFEFWIIADQKAEYEVKKNQKRRNISQAPSEKMTWWKFLIASHILSKDLPEVGSLSITASCSFLQWALRIVCFTLLSLRAWG